jgi:tripartite-type tricarboxylate transporter receptor subunit TctC
LHTDPEETLPMSALLDRPARPLRRRSLAGLTAATLLGAMTVAAPVSSQTAWPERAIRVVVPFPPGGLVDASMRSLAPKMSEALGQTLVIDNKGGAGGSIGMAEVARSAPDGYTLLFAIESMTLAPYLYRSPGFDPLQDLQPISQVLSVPIAILVHPSLPVTNLRELAAWSRANPGRVSAGSGGVGTATHLCLEALKAATQSDYVHIPYKGAGPAFTDFLAGQTQLFAVSTSFSAPHVKTGKVRAIAMASNARTSNLPDVPTIAEQGFGSIEYSTWMGLLGPAGLPAPIVTRVRDAALRALADPGNRARFAEQGLEIHGTTPDAFRRFIASESAKYGKVVALAGIKPE